MDNQKTFFDLLIQMMILDEIEIEKELYKKNSYIIYNFDLTVDGGERGFAGLMIDGRQIALGGYIDNNTIITTTSTHNSGDYTIYI